MKSGDALQAFKHIFAVRGTTVTNTAVSDGIDAMLEFYRSTRADDCVIAEDGDMLLFQWGTYDWGRGPHFELDITRQFIRAGGEDEDEDIWQLSLTFVYPPSAIASGNRWCHKPEDTDDFATFVRSHAAYAAATRAAPLRVDLDFERAG